MRAHTIADLRQAERSTSWTLCSCGWRCEGARPETTAELFAAHRREVGAPYRVPSDVIRSGGGADPYRSPRKPRVGPSVDPSYWPTW